MGDMTFIPGDGEVTGMLIGEVIPGGLPCWPGPGDVTG